MRSVILCLAVLTLLATGASADSPRPEWALVIHGGAGTILKEKITDDKERAYLDALRSALAAGEDVLANGGSSVDAVEAVITLMEDSPLFNAGKGAVFTEAGVNEMDASIMDGADLNAGAVAGVKTVKNPILAARAVMEKSPHVMMARDGAEAFAAAQGLQMVDPEYFWTKNRWEALLKAREKRAEAGKHGTVGCVALDKGGNIAAGTSTGGMTMKMWGRIGDSPVIGAGTYANNRTCGVSATGHGEYFIRNVVAYDISALMEYGGMSLAAAADRVVMEKLVAQEATGGIVALDKNGNIAMPFNTAGMYRGFLKSTGETGIFIYGADTEGDGE